MVIDENTATIDIYPFIDFTNIANVNIEVWHKDTKTKVTGTSAVTKVASKVTITLPALTAIAAVANNYDQVQLRLLDGTALVWDYLLTWSNESIDINKEFKEWTEPAPGSPEWTTLQ